MDTLWALGSVYWESLGALGEHFGALGGPWRALGPPLERSGDGFVSILGVFLGWFWYREVRKNVNGEKLDFGDLLDGIATFLSANLDEQIAKKPTAFTKIAFMEIASMNATMM